MSVTRNCATCGIPFRGRANNAKYCSEACRSEVNRLSCAIWRSENLEKIAATRARSYRRLTEERRQVMRDRANAWNKANRERLRENQRAWTLECKVARQVVKELLTQKEMENVVSAELSSWIKGSNAAIMASEQPARVASRASRWKRWQKPRAAPAAVRRAGARTGRLFVNNH